MRYVHRQLLSVGIWLCMAVASIIVLASKRSEWRETAVQSDRLLPKLGDTEPRLLGFIRDDQEITFEKRSSWYAQSPVDMPADSDAVKEVIHALRDMRVIRPVQIPRDNKSSLHDIGVEPAKFAWRIALGDQRWTLKFGQQAPGVRAGTYVSLTDSEESAPRFYVVNAQLSLLDIQPERLLDSRLLPTSVESVQELGLETPQVRLHARRNPHSAQWFTVEPPSLRLVPERVATLFRSLGALRIGLHKPAQPAHEVRASVTIKLVHETGETKIEILDSCDKDPRFFWTRRQDIGVTQACVDTLPLQQVLPSSTEAWHDTKLFTLRMDEVESITSRIGRQKVSVSRDGTGFTVSGTESNRLPLDAGNGYLEKLLSARGELVQNLSVAQSQVTAADEYIEVRSSTAAQDGDSLVERLVLGPATGDGGRLVKRTDDNAVLKLDRATLGVLTLGAKTMAP